MSTQTLKGQIEAVLFLTGRALTIRDIADKLERDPEEIEEALLELINDYAYREESSLEIDDTDGYILQVKDHYETVVNRMVPVDLSHPALRLLSAIAIHGPLLQSDLITSQGSGAYDYLKELHSQGLISKRRKDRTYMLSVTPKFHQYFKLTGDKEELKSLFAQLQQPAPEALTEAPTAVEG